jgi:hypothetical protein
MRRFCALFTHVAGLADHLALDTSSTRIMSGGRPNLPARLSLARRTPRRLLRQHGAKSQAELPCAPPTRLPALQGQRITALDKGLREDLLDRSRRAGGVGCQYGRGRGDSLPELFRLGVVCRRLRSGDVARIRLGGHKRGDPRTVLSLRGGRSLQMPGRSRAPGGCEDPEMDRQAAVVTISGPVGAGKTTLAVELDRLLSATVVSTRDLLVERGPRSSRAELSEARRGAGSPHGRSLGGLPRYGEAARGAEESAGGR